MPDLTMCINDDCPLAATCYRHEAKPTPGRQSFAAFKQNADGTCDGFLEIWGME